VLVQQLNQQQILNQYFIHKVPFKIFIKLNKKKTKVTKFLREFNVEDKTHESLTDQYINLRIVHKYVSDLDAENHVSKSIIILIINKQCLFLSFKK
jgi:hypothetical protein